ncbi:MAG TPA: hypothetical protein DEF18_06445 [Muricauda sp.]|jgi:hypothetical protein|uniref:hypothetical protein n=1 Tax=Muricauda brasiliensis TaxID=2162892 RepID=UPI000C4711EF|nr:hypothetical protein [Muricauda brasiliensis]MAO16590.1 hypothetical protein [Allomuricauda sp.]MBC72526.1 hypothetical protein [Allomuricauda sp.]HBU77724.1 hypothetical protein [Allomuricauda sp.]|tara:strand:+ start:1557 stop:1766 length:210 start_codon:yes stop_codon:yes gene_type:complete
MGTLAIGISLIMVIYALFLHITYHYILGNGNFKGLHLNHFFKKLKKLRNLRKLKEFLKSTNHMGRLQKQ